VWHPYFVPTCSIVIIIGEFVFTQVFRVKLTRFTLLHTWLIYDRNSLVGIVIRHGMDGPGFNPGGDEIFHTRPDRPRVPLTSVQWVPDLFSGGKVTLGMTAWCSDMF
jgi:hypothetical protein